jgi:N-acetylmuramoyl-L-alanine amidase
MLKKGFSKQHYWFAGGFILILLVGVTVYLSLFYQGPIPAPGYNAFDSRDMRVADASPASYVDNLNLIARVIQGEADNEPFTGKVAVGAVLLNRVGSSSFPKSLSGVVFEPYAFESVSNGLIWRYSPSWDSIRAASSALSGWDPSSGALFFWNPSKQVSAWIWTRSVITQIGHHIFAR